MTLIKTSLLNAISVSIKMLTLLGINKILAIYVGPQGYATIGQFQNVVQMITTFVSGAVNTGVTKYTAEYQEDIQMQRAVWRTAGSIAMIFSVLCTIVLIMFSKGLSESILGDETLSSVFVWLGITLPLIVFNTFVLAILNGLKEIKLYVIASIFGSVISLIVTGMLSMQYGLYGSLVSLTVYQSISFFATIYICFKKEWFNVRNLIGGYDKNIIKKLVKYTAMAITSAVCIPTSQILIRNHLGATLGWDAAGYWEAMWRLSGAYLMLVTTTLSVYYLPRLSELKDNIRIRNEIISGYKIILPAAMICGALIYILRDLIIVFLFSNRFENMEVLFGWQIFGDMLKIGSWILAFVMLSKAMTRMYIVTEIIFSAMLVMSIYVFEIFYGLKGAAIGYAITYMIYWILLWIMIMKKTTVDTTQA